MISATHLHAMLIHFPIALLFAGFFSEIISIFSNKNYFKNTALLLLGLGTLGAISAFLSGNAAGEGIEHGALKIPVELHEDAALFSLFLIVVTALFYAFTYFFDFKDAAIRWFRILFFTITIVSISYTGYLGGQLVYKHGAGVELGLPDFTNSNPED